jgi:hypothetical protein
MKNANRLTRIRIGSRNCTVALSAWTCVCPSTTVGTRATCNSFSSVSVYESLAGYAVQNQRP